MACLLYWLNKCVSHISQKKSHHLTYQNLIVTHRGLEYYHFNFRSSYKRLDVRKRLLLSFGLFFSNFFHARFAAFLHPQSLSFPGTNFMDQCLFFLQSFMKDLIYSSSDIDFLKNIYNKIYRYLYTIPFIFKTSTVEPLDRTRSYFAYDSLYLQHLQLF